MTFVQALRLLQKDGLLFNACPLYPEIRHENAYHLISPHLATLLVEEEYVVVDDNNVYGPLIISEKGRDRLRTVENHGRFRRLHHVS